MADQQPALFDIATLKGTDNLHVLRERALICRKCKLAETRKNVVYGIGRSVRPDIAFVGEGPGENEDIQGKPFVGKAGQLLTKMIAAIGYTREEVYICNVVGCRPPANRKPEPEEVKACNEHLAGQLRTVNPRVIVALGASAAQAICNSEKGISLLRGKWLSWEGIPVRATFHPSYLLRTPAKKKDAWADFQVIQRQIDALLKLDGQPAQGHGNERSTEHAQGDPRDRGSSGQQPLPEDAGNRGEGVSQPTRSGGDDISDADEDDVKVDNFPF